MFAISAQIDKHLRDSRRISLSIQTETAITLVGEITHFVDLTGIRENYRINRTHINRA